MISATASASASAAVFSSAFVDKLVITIIKYSQSEPRFYGYGRRPYSPAHPAYLVRNEEGLWEAKWLEKAPEGALFLADAEKRGVPHEEFNALAYLTYSLTATSSYTNKFLTDELQCLRKWISARLESGLTPENEAMVAPFYTEPQDVWPRAWSIFKSKYEEISAETVKFQSAIGLSCGSSGAELDKRDAVAKAWRIRRGYEAE